MRKQYKNAEGSNWFLVKSREGKTRGKEQNTIRECKRGKNHTDEERTTRTLAKKCAVFVQRYRKERKARRKRDGDKINSKCRWREKRLVKEN